MQLAGTRALLYAFNGQVPGPLMELEPGDEVRLRFTNQLPEPTNLHFHGTHLSPEGKADNVFLQIPAGEVFDYSFRVPLNHPAGFFWVHPHLQGRVARQVSLGLAAPFVIRGALDRIPEVSAAREHFLILQDFELDSRSRPVDPGMSAMMLGREGSLITVSGMRNPQYVIEQDGLLSRSLFTPAETCMACHNNLTSSQGEDVSIGSMWRSTMMANSGGDPYFQISRWSCATSRLGSDGRRT